MLTCDLFAEKTAIAFKKSKAASSEQLDDVNATSPMSSLNGSGQQKSDEVNFLGEISDEDSSDSDSSDSDSELENGEEDDLIKRKNSQGSGASGLDAEKREHENNRTDKESSELKDPSAHVTSDTASALKDTPDTCEASSSSTDLVVDKSEEKNKEQDSSESESCSSAMLDNKEGKNKVQDSSQLSNDSVSAVKDTRESLVSDADLSAMIKKSEGKIEMDDSSSKQEDRSGDEKSYVKDNVGEFVEGSLGEEESKDTRVDDEETKTECPSVKEEIEADTQGVGKEADVKTENLSDANEKKLTNVDVSVSRNDGQNAKSDLIVEKINSQGQLEEDEIEKPHQHEVQLDRESLRHDEDNKVKAKEETHEQHNRADTELNHEQVNENEPASQEQGSKDEGKEKTASETDSWDAQDSENKQTN